MSTVGKGQLSLRKQDVITQKNLGVGIAKLEFAHKAAGGESTLDLTALVAPTEMLSNGFVQPSLGSLSDANIYIYRHNLTLISSLRGKLLDYLSYTVASNTIINFQGFTLQPNEIIVGILDPMPRNNLMVVDGQAIVATGTLGVGLTDFNAGTPFEINKYSSQQIGAVLVYRNGALQERCIGNDALNAGDYTEVQVTGGMGSLIRFKVAPVGTPDKIVVVSNGAYFERPVDSQMASIENLGGQMDKVIQEVAILSGLPTSNFQSNPNEVDLRQFGDRVLTLEQRLLETVYIKDYQTQNTAGQTASSASFAATRLNTTEGDTSLVVSLAGNQFVLAAGTYKIRAKVPFGPNTGGSTYANFASRLRNVTDSTNVLIGTSLAVDEASAGYQSMGHSFIEGQFTIAASKTLEIQHRSSGAGVIGWAHNLQQELYTVVELQRIG